MNSIATLDTLPGSLEGGIWRVSTDGVGQKFSHRLYFWAFTRMLGRESEGLEGLTVVFGRLELCKPCLTRVSWSEDDNDDQYHSDTTCHLLRANQEPGTVLNTCILWIFPMTLWVGYSHYTRILWMRNTGPRSPGGEWWNQDWNQLWAWPLHISPAYCLPLDSPLLQNQHYRGDWIIGNSSVINSELCTHFSPRLSEASAMQCAFCSGTPLFGGSWEAILAQPKMNYNVDDKSPTPSMRYGPNKIHIKLRWSQVPKSHVRKPCFII